MRLFVVALATAVLAPCSSLADPPPPVEAEAQSSPSAADADQQEEDATEQEQVQQQQGEPQVTCRTVRRRTESRLGSRRERVCTPVQGPASADAVTQGESAAEGDAAPEAH